MGAAATWPAAVGLGHGPPTQPSRGGAGLHGALSAAPDKPMAALCWRVGCFQRGAPRPPSTVSGQRAGGTGRQGMGRRTGVEDAQCSSRPDTAAAFSRCCWRAGVRHPFGLWHSVTGRQPRPGHHQQRCGPAGSGGQSHIQGSAYICGCRGDGHFAAGRQQAVRCGAPSLGAGVGMPEPFVWGSFAAGAPWHTAAGGQRATRSSARREQVRRWMAMAAGWGGSSPALGRAGAGALAQAPAPAPVQAALAGPAWGSRGSAGVPGCGRCTAAGVGGPCAVRLRRPAALAWEGLTCTRAPVAQL